MNRTRLVVLGLLSVASVNAATASDQRVNPRPPSLTHREEQALVGRAARAIDVHPARWLVPDGTLQITAAFVPPGQGSEESQLRVRFELQGQPAVSMRIPAGGRLSTDGVLETEAPDSPFAQFLREVLNTHGVAVRLSQSEPRYINVRFSDSGGRHALDRWNMSFSEADGAWASCEMSGSVSTRGIGRLSARLTSQSAERGPFLRIWRDDVDRAPPYVLNHRLRLPHPASADELLAQLQNVSRAADERQASTDPQPPARPQTQQSREQHATRPAFLTAEDKSAAAELAARAFQAHPFYYLVPGNGLQLSGVHQADQMTLSFIAEQQPPVRLRLSFAEGTAQQMDVECDDEAHPIAATLRELVQNHAISIRHIPGESDDFVRLYFQKERGEAPFDRLAISFLSDGSWSGYELSQFTPTKKIQRLSVRVSEVSAQRGAPLVLALPDRAQEMIGLGVENAIAMPGPMTIQERLEGVGRLFTPSSPSPATASTTQRATEDAQLFNLLQRAAGAPLSAWLEQRVFENPLFRVIPPLFKLAAMPTAWGENLTLPPSAITLALQPVRGRTGHPYVVTLAGGDKHSARLIVDQAQEGNPLNELFAHLLETMTVDTSPRPERETQQQVRFSGPEGAFWLSFGHQLPTLWSQLGVLVAHRGHHGTYQLSHIGLAERNPSLQLQTANLWVRVRDAPMPPQPPTVAEARQEIQAWLDKTGGTGAVRRLREQGRVSSVNHTLVAWPQGRN